MIASVFIWPLLLLVVVVLVVVVLVVVKVLRRETVYLYSAFYKKIVSRCFAKSKTQSLNPEVITVARKNSLLKERNLEQNPAHKEEPSY